MLNKALNWMAKSDSFISLSFSDTGQAVDSNSSSKILSGADQNKIELLEKRLTSSNPTPATPSTPAPSQTPPNSSPTLLTANPTFSFQTDEEDNSNSALLNNSSSSSKKVTRRRFSPEEDKVLLEGYEKFGPEWEKIIEYGQSICTFERTVDQIKRRFKRIQTKKEAAEVSEPPMKKQKICHPSVLEEPESGQLKSKEKLLAKQQRELEEMKKKLEEQQEHLKLEAARISIIEKSLRDKELIVQKREKEIVDQEQGINRKVREVLQELLIEKSERERKDARVEVQQKCHKLGQLIYERRLNECHEVWKEGSSFEELKRRKRELTQIRNEIEEERKELKKLKREKSDTADDFKSGAYIAQQEDIFRMRVQRIKKEKVELNTKREDLLFRKKLHLRELKRCNDEEGSRFNGHPVLNDRYLLLNLLGKGGFSEVYKAFDLQALRYVACKIHQLSSHWNEQKKQNYTKHAVREYNIHKDLEHPRVVSLFDVFKIDNSSFCTVLEYCEGGDLDTYLKMRNRLSERESKLIMQQIFFGLKYLNERKTPIIHYDLKPGNILFTRDGGVKITDFGLSKIMEEDQKSMDLTSQGAGTYWYLPPECFEIGKTPPKISSKVDVWSAGVMFYQLLYGQKPFGNNYSQQKLLVENIITNDTIVQFPNKPGVSAKVKNFIRSCLTPVQAERPDVLTICTDSYLTE